MCHGVRRRERESAPAKIVVRSGALECQRAVAGIRWFETIRPCHTVVVKWSPFSDALVASL